MNIKTNHVVTCFLLYNNKILLLKRSQKVGSNKGKWCGISGYVEKNENELERAKIEIREETGIKNVDLVKKGKPLSVKEKGCVWFIHPFLFKVLTDKIILNWEHTEYKWIDPKEINKYEIVKMLKEALDAVL